LLIVAVALASLLWVIVAVDPTSGGNIAEFSTSLVKVGTVVLGGLLCLGAIAHSVNSVSRELEKDTLDGLLTLPLGRSAVLEAKWLGGIVSLRLLGLVLICLWVFGLATGGLHPLSLAALVLSVAAVVEFLASLGLWLSTVCKTSLRANMAAVLLLLLIACGPWILGNYLEMFAPYSYAHRLSDEVPALAMPAVAWVRLCVGWHAYAKLPEGYFPALLFASLVYAVLAWMLWRATLRRFLQYGGKRA
jgi:ABC-type transport system involved in multi-copper enzyme maturation permease subunit